MLQNHHRDKTEVACLAPQVTVENHSGTCRLIVYVCVCVCVCEFNGGGNGGTRTEQ